MSRWKRPVTKTYDYNFKLGEHYYKPQLDYLESRKGRGNTPPTAKTFAERFAEDPVYGNYSGPSYRKSRDGLGEGLGSAGRFGSLDDISLRNKGSMFAMGDDLESKFTPTSPRLIVGDRLLDSVGIKESQLSSALNLSSLNSSFSSRAQRQSEDLDQQSLSRRKQLVSFAQSAGADTVSEDPFKTRVSSKMVAARKQADEMMDEMKRDSEASVSRFRSRATARREEQSKRQDQLQSSSSSGFAFTDDDAEAAAVRSRVNEIGLRAKARLAQLEDDFPEIEIGSSLAARRAAANSASWSSSMDDDSSKQTSASSRTVKITKRTVKASYETE